MPKIRPLSYNSDVAVTERRQNDHGVATEPPVSSGVRQFAQLSVSCAASATRYVINARSSGSTRDQAYSIGSAPSRHCAGELVAGRWKQHREQGAQGGGDMGQRMFHPVWSGCAPKNQGLNPRLRKKFRTIGRLPGWLKRELKLL